MYKMMFCIWSLLSINSLKANDSTQLVAPKKVFEKFLVRHVDTTKITIQNSRSEVLHIDILDYRLDTTHIGAYFRKHNKSAWINLPSNYNLNKVFNTAISNAKGTTNLLGIVGQFWLTESPINRVINTDRLNITANSSLRKFIYKCDFYYEVGGKYSPLIRIDTSFSLVSNASNFEPADIFLNAAFELSQQKITSALENIAINRKRISKEEIISNYNLLKEFPITKDSVLKKGVYITHKEFLNNTPSILEYSIQASKNEPASLYIKGENGNTLLSRDSWGFCDGTNIYINIRGMLFSLAKVNGTFYWLGINAFKETYSAIPLGFPVGGGWFVVGTEPISGSVKAIQSLFTLNMETGYAL